MTVETTTNIVIYTGSGTTGPFDFPFIVQSKNHLVLQRKNIATGELEYTYSASEFTVVGLGEATGGSVTLTSALSSAYRLVISRQVPYTQTLDILNQAGFYPANVEQAFDFQEMQIQQIREKLGRAVVAPIGDTLTELPRQSIRGGKMLGFSSNGDISLTDLILQTLEGIGAVDSRTVMANLTATNGAFCYLAEDGREGWFRFSTSDLSSLVSLDVAQGVYVAPASDTDGSSGAWVRLVKDVLNLRWFGADNTGTASAISAFNNVIAFAASQYPTGVTVYIPDGQYKMDSSVNTITTSALSFKGESTFSTILVVSATGSLFTWDDDSWGGGFYNMRIRYPSAPAATAIIFNVLQATNKKFVELGLENFNTAGSFGGGLGVDRSGAIYWENCYGEAYNSGKPTFDLRNGSGFFLRECSFYVGSIDVPAATRESTMTTAEDTNFINVTSGSWDSFFMTNSCSCNRYWHGLNVDAPKAIVNNFWFTNAIVDYCSSDAFSIKSIEDPEAEGVGAVATFFINNCYISSWSGNGVLVQGTNYLNNINVKDNVFIITGKNGIDISGEENREVSISGNIIMDANRLEGTYSAIRLGGDLPGPCDVINNRSFHSAIDNLPWEVTYGITVEATVLGYLITGNALIGDTANYNISYPWITDAGSPNRTRFVYNNRGADYTGWKDDSNFEWPLASASTWRNNSPFNVEIITTGVSITTTDIHNVAADPSTFYFTQVGNGEQAQMGTVLQPGDIMYLAYEGSYSASKHKLFYKVSA